MQIPIMAGMTARDGVFAAEYPVNLEPRAKTNGLSQGQLVATRGAVQKATGLGIGRGGILWNGDHYRVSGSRLIRVNPDWTVTNIGDVGNDTKPCGFDYSFDRLSINSAGKLFYYDGTTLIEVTDPDLGTVLDHLWIDGYFVTTDGEFLIATELLDPTSVSPLKYGSAEQDPDPLTGVIKVRGELYGIGRHTIQVFFNVGGLNFPFAVNTSATIPFGCISASAKCMVAGQSFAFVGGARNEPLGLFVMSNGGAERISNIEIEKLLAAEIAPELIELECRTFGEEFYILMHLAGRTIGVSLQASKVAEEGAWFVLHSDGPYRPRHAIWAYGSHIVDDCTGTAIGELTTGTAAHFGITPDWELSTALMFSDGAAFGIDEVELFGQFPLDGCTVFFAMTRDGAIWSNEIARTLDGRRDERVVWRPSLRVRTLVGFKWRGKGRVALARADVRGEAMA
jgi:Phage stabilisation protein